MPLINCEINVILTWPSTCVITNSAGATRLAITDTKPYIRVVTLSTHDNAKLLQQLKSNLVLKEQLTGVNTNKIQKHMCKKKI